MRSSKLFLTNKVDREPSTIDQARAIFQRLLTDKVADPVVIKAVLLPDPRSRWRSFGLSVLLISNLMLMCVALQFFFPDRIEPMKHYFSMSITRTSPEAPKPPIKRFIKVLVRPPAPTPIAAQVPATEPVLAEVEAPPRVLVPVTTAARPSPTRRNKSIEPFAEVPISASAPTELPTPKLTIPALTKPREEVHTGLFGGTNGSVTGQSDSGHGTFVNAKFGGSNGTGAANGAGNGHRVVEGAFADSADVKGESKVASTKAVTTTAVKILSKPKPAYTAEGRSRGIEGDVVLKVMFNALGKVEVLSVVRGLGFGLDESAEAAAKQIQFQPATSNGIAVDSPATIHIAFQIAQ